MKEMVSGINSIPTNTFRSVLSLKKGQDEGTNRLASDTTGILGAGDTDMPRFLTAPFKTMRMLQVKSGPDIYGTLGIIPEQQHPFDGVPFFRDGQIRAIDRAGSSSFTNNLVRTGPAPDGYTRGETILIQKRIAHTFNPAIDRVSYTVEVREVAKDYVLQPDERYDGDFRPINGLGLGLDFLSTYPINDQGLRLYNANPLKEAGWDGTTFTVAYNPETIPVLSSIDPTTYQLPDNGGASLGLILGRNMNLFDTVLIGLYRTGMFSTFTDSAFYLYPSGMLPGIYDIMVVGQDGQIGILPNALTVLAEVP